MGDSAAISKLIVHSVHGTWPDGFWKRPTTTTSPTRANGELRWFSPGSSFQHTLAESSVRPLNWIPFEWSGRNSFSARMAAANALSEHLVEWFSAEPHAEHVILAHSHGGSVSIAAAQLLEEKNNNRLSKIITLATPFVSKRPSQYDVRLLAIRYMIFRFGWLPLLIFGTLLYLIGIAEYWHILAIFFLYMSIMIVVVAPLFFLLWKAKLLKFKAPHEFVRFVPISKSCSIYAIRASLDEATIAIYTSLFINLISDFLFRKCLWLIGWTRVQPISDRNHRDKRFWWRYVWIGAAFWAIALGINLSDLTKTIYAYVPKEALFQIWSVIQFFLSTIIFGTGIIFALISLLGPLILLPAHLILGLTFGWDTIRDRGLVEIECESIPSGVTGTVSTINLSDTEQSRLRFAHFIHETHAARLRVAEILRATSSG